MNKLHLTVFQPKTPPDGDPTQAGLWNPERVEFAWSHNFAAFRPVHLKWWDDRSYIAYQCGELPDSDAFGYTTTKVVRPRVSVRPAPSFEAEFGADSEEIPF